MLQQKLMLFAKLRSRIGVPQAVALLLLLVFVAQCLWFMARVPLSATEGSYIETGLLHLERFASASSPERSPLVPLLAGLAARLSGAESRILYLNDYRFVIRLPFLLVGLLLGASLWYVARRLYGNIGGYIALGLYSFSPVIVGWSSQVGPGIVGAWGGFGLIFTAIAVAHTLYAPREVVLWNWRRILLMGLSIAICVGAQFSLWILLVPALAFMLWVGHVRPGAAMAIFAAACAFGLLLLWAVYSFRPAAFATALHSATWLRPPADDPSWHSATSLFATFFLQNGLGLVLLLAVCVVTFAAWKRARFFGTAAPLIVGAILVGMATRMHFAGPMFLLAGLPFLILFMAGVSTDLLEGSYALAANTVIGGVLIANAMIDVYGLLHLTSRSR
ncbi:MAG TPA: glycosyltransferase family 39 protein [Terriglobales bacterium]|nr:glycosyltransferase family 39 protein [Terriglobales bacterium]